MSLPHYIRRAEYDRVLPVLTRHYDRLSARDKKVLEAIDADWNKGQFQALEDYVRKHIDAHAFEFKREPLPKLATNPAVEAPPEGIWFHGTSQNDRLMWEGLCPGPASHVTGFDNDYGWNAWKEEIWDSWKSDLSPAQRVAVEKHIGVGSLRAKKFAQLAFGEHTRLFFVSSSLREAHGYGGVTYQVDVHALRYYWYFQDSLAEKTALCFVCPFDCPLALPSAFKKVSREG